MSGCGCNGGGKCNRPREEFSLSPAIVESLVKNLIGVATTGIKNLPWPSEEAAQLATMIADMLAENERLRALLGLRKPPTPEVNIDAHVVFLAFGPEGQYKLHFPVSSVAQRKEFADQLSAAAAELRKAPSAQAPLPGQLPLPFSH